MNRTAIGRGKRNEMNDTVKPEHQWCVIIWKWAKDYTIKDAYVDTTVGPLTRREANALAARINRDSKRRRANRWKLQPLESETR